MRSLPVKVYRGRGILGTARDFGLGGEAAECLLDYSIIHSSPIPFQLCLCDPNMLLYCVCVAPIYYLFTQNPFPIPSYY